MNELTFRRINPQIRTQITNTVACFTIVALVSTFVFLIANAVAVGLAAKSIPTPLLKRIAIQGLDEGPARMYLDIEFPATGAGNLISAQTDGPLKVSLFVSDKKNIHKTNPALTMEIPNGVNLNLASESGARLVIDDLQIKFDDKFDAGIFSRILNSKIRKDFFNQELIPDVVIRIETRIVIRSLWIPIGFSINYPHNLKLDNLLDDKQEQGTTTGAAKEKSDESNATGDTKENETNSLEKHKNPHKNDVTIELTEYEKQKEEIIKNFDFKPRLVQIISSYSDKFEVEAVGAFPAIMIPTFLTVQVPAISLKANFFLVENEHEKISTGPFLSMGEVKIEPFLLHTAPLNDLKKEIQFKVTLKIENDDVKGLSRLLELVRDEQKEKIGIQILQGNNEKKIGGLMHWLKDFVIDIPLKYVLKNEQPQTGTELVESLENKSVAKLDDTEEKHNPNQHIEENGVKKKIAAFNFLRIETLNLGGSFIFQIKILRSAAPFIMGKLPELDFGVITHNESDDKKNAKLFTINVTSNEVTKETEVIEINIKLNVENFEYLVYSGLRANKMGSDKYHKKVPEVKQISSLKVNSNSNNIISKLASVFNVEILFNDDGIDKIKFQNSEKVIFPKPIKEDSNEVSKKIDNPKIEIVTKKKQLELKSKFAISDEQNIVKIASSLQMDEIFYNNDYVHASWENFTLKLKYMEETILQFQIQKGSMDVGVKNDINPIFINFSTDITIPSEERNLKKLSEILKSFLESENDILDLRFEIFSESEANGSFILNAPIPCKMLLNPETVKKIEASDGNIAVEEKKPETDQVKDQLPNESNSVSIADHDKSKAKEQLAKEDHENFKKTPEKDEPKINEVPTSKREDFIGKIQNSILSFISFQASTWLFHVSYPDGQYCKNVDSFDLKLNVEISLPMIEANVCSKPRIEDELSCFASAGISRPMKYFIDIIDDQICHVASEVIIQKEKTLPDENTRQNTEITYVKNEIPIHISIKDVPNLVLFGEWAATKKTQFVTLGPVKDGSAFNNLIGYIVSTSFSKIIPEPEVKQNEKDGAIGEKASIEKGEIHINDSTETVASKDSANKVAEKSILSAKKIISFNLDTPAILQFQGFSKDQNNLEILLGFKLPENAFENIRIAEYTKNKFEWPVLQWGMFDYSVGIEDIFELSFSMKRGQIDIQDDFDGIVPVLLKDFALRIKLQTNKQYTIGSTGLRQVFGKLNSYFQNGDDKEKTIEIENFFEQLPKKHLFYKFIMNGPRGLNDESILYSKGMVQLMDLVNVGKAIYTRRKHPDDNIGIIQNESKIGSNSIDNNSNEPDENNIFEKAKITMKTIPKDHLEQINFPCLIPALCGEDFSSSEDGKVQNNPFDMIFDIENVLQPATQLVASKLGSVLENFKMTHYPSHFRIKFIAENDIWVTLMLNGAGIVSVGLKPFEFDRTAFIEYNKDTTADFIPEGVSPDILNNYGNDQNIDNFNIILNIKFPDSIVGLRSALAIFRKESLFMPPIAPVPFNADENSVKLSNPPFAIALSSDDPEKSESDKNLLSALIASMIPEKVFPGINPNDELISIFNDYHDFGNQETKPQEAQKKSKSTDNGTNIEIGSLDYTKIGRLIACLFTGTNCGTQFDMNFNVMMPFDVKFLKLLLPSTSIVRLFVDNAPIFQVVADAKEQRKLEVSSEKGLHILGTSNLCFSGLKQVSDTSTNRISSYLFSTKSVPMKFQVIFGHDINLTANLHFPFYAAASIVQKYGVKQFGSFFGFKSSKQSPISMSTKLFDESRPERKECLDHSLSEDDINARINDISYENTVLFYDQKDIELSPEKKFNLYFQLRTKKDLVVCNSPFSDDKLKVIFIYESQRNSFINLIKTLTNSIDKNEFSFDAMYDMNTNLFKLNDVILPYTGRYLVKVNGATNENSSKVKEFVLSNTILYLKHEY